MGTIGQVLAASLVLAATQQAFSQEVSLRQLAAGTVFTFDTDSGPVKVTVKKMDGVAILQEQESARGVYSNENIGFGATLGTQQKERMTDEERAQVSTLFPLKVGNSVRSGHSGTSASGFTWSTSDKMEVSGQERVTVPAGSFDTFIIETSMTGDRWWGQNTCWYAPEIGYCVKRKWRSASNGSDWSLVSVTQP
jgi:hypothetical protein